MVPIPTNPTVVVLINAGGGIDATASNISEMKIVATYSNKEFRQESCNRAFIDYNPDVDPVNNPSYPLR